MGRSVLSRRRRQLAAAVVAMVLLLPVLRGGPTLTQLTHQVAQAPVGCRARHCASSAVSK